MPGIGRSSMRIASQIVNCRFCSHDVLTWMFQTYDVIEMLGCFTANARFSCKMTTRCQSKRKTRQRAPQAQTAKLVAPGPCDRHLHVRRRRGGLFYALRPVTLSIAVGPTGRDDVKLIKGFAQAFFDGSSVRLKPIDAGRRRNRAVHRQQGRPRGGARRSRSAGKRQSVAILRKNVVVLWAPKGAKGAAVGEDQEHRRSPGHKVGVIGSAGQRRCCA